MAKLTPIEMMRFSKFVKQNNLLKEDGQTFKEPITEVSISPTRISVKLESGKSIINEI